MQGNEIIKALECCSKHSGNSCSRCPYHEYGELCIETRNADIVDLINRLKAENSNLSSDLTSLKKDLTSAKAEIERLQGDVPKLIIKNIPPSLAYQIKTSGTLAIQPPGEARVEIIPSKETIIKEFAEQLRTEINERIEIIETNPFRKVDKSFNAHCKSMLQGLKEALAIIDKSSTAGGETNG